MADLKTHSNDCVKILGSSFREVHEWLDRFADKKDPKIEHRQKTHHWDGVIEAVEKFGPKSGAAAIIHILRDINGIMPSKIDVEIVIETHEFPEEDWLCQQL